MADQSSQNKIFTADTTSLTLKSIDQEGGGPLTESSSGENCTHDPRNPINWPSWRKWTIVALFWLTSLLLNIGCTAFEPALPSILADFDSRDLSLEPFMVSIFAIGYFFAPLLFSPATEIYGRVAVLYPSFILYFVAIVVCATSNDIAVFIFFRAVMGFAAIAAFIVETGIIADIIPKARRGIAVSCVTSGMYLGPTLGPVIGGYVAQKLGWRWTFWIPTALLGILVLGLLPILRETFLPILQTRSHPGRQSPSRSWGTFRLACTRPFRFICQTRLIPLFSCYTLIVNSYLFLMIGSMGTIFQSVYHFSPGNSGLTYLGMFCGFALSISSIGYLTDRLVSCRAESRPEDRLPPLILSAILFPLGLLLYGWSLQLHLPWIAPIIASGVVAFAAIYALVPVQVYVVEVFSLHAASATGALVIVRAFPSAFVPLAADPLYLRLGYGWSHTLLAAIAVPFAFAGALLYRFGENIRLKDKSVS